MPREVISEFSDVVPGFRTNAFIIDVGMILASLGVEGLVSPTVFASTEGMQLRLRLTAQNSDGTIQVNEDDTRRDVDINELLRIVVYSIQNEEHLVR